jgi:excisionase family DNA binding protein
MESDEVLKVHTVPEVAKILRIGRNQAYEMAAQGKIPAIRLGKRLIVPDVALRKMLSDTA